MHAATRALRASNGGLQIADPQPTGRVRELQDSDLQADRSCVSCSRVDRIRLKRNLVVDDDDDDAEPPINVARNNVDI